MNITALATSLKKYPSPYRSFRYWQRFVSLITEYHAEEYLTLQEDKQIRLNIFKGFLQNCLQSPDLFSYSCFRMLTRV